MLYSKLIKGTDMSIHISRRKALTIGTVSTGGLLTRNIKNTMICVLERRQALALRTGLINSIEAPVVPIQEARTVPIRRNIRFSWGVPLRVPLTSKPPDTVYSAHSKIIKGKYSIK